MLGEIKLMHLHNIIPEVALESINFYGFIYIMAYRIDRIRFFEIIASPLSHSQV